MRHEDRRAAGTAAWVAAIGMISCGTSALADVGRRDFVDTMLIEDPQPDDTLTFPAFTMQSFNGGGGEPPTREYEFGLEVEKRITARLSLSLSSGYSIVTTPGRKSQTGWEQLEMGAKLEVFRSPEHEFALSLGILREFGGTGSPQVNEARTGVTTPLVLFGKGFGDLPIGILRPLAVTGQFGYSVADRKLKATTVAPDDDDEAAGPAAVVFNSGLENRWLGGFSVQYSFLYLDAEVKRTDWPDWVVGLTPIVEVLWSSPASKPSREGTQWLIAPGLVWSNERWQLGIEALIPGNRESGRNIGVIAQLKVSLGEIAPRLGKPVF